MSEDVLARVLGLLEQIGIPSMLVGSFASNYYGEPRSTHDADVVIKLRWAMETESAQQRHDVEAIIRGQEGRLDWEYLRSWAERLSVRGSLEALRAH